jgi:hypothetical protein
MQVERWRQDDRESDAFALFVALIIGQGLHGLIRRMSSDPTEWQKALPCPAQAHRSCSTSQKSYSSYIRNVEAIKQLVDNQKV